MKNVSTNFGAKVSNCAEPKKKTDDVFVLIEVSKLSMTDKFMQHKPETYEQKVFKETLMGIIQSNLKDFYRPRYDPGYEFDGHKDICFEPGKKPAVGQSNRWWRKKARMICPERNSRLGTKQEYFAFLGVLIKKMVDQGWTVSQAWKAVCDDSSTLGHYNDSKNAKKTFERTGSREICGFFDLANTSKIIDQDEYGFRFYRMGSCYLDEGNRYPLTHFFKDLSTFNPHDYSVGWIVLEK